jgi:N-acetylated-alpha-linked acidic dipeptidase
MPSRSRRRSLCTVTVFVAVLIAPGLGSGRTFGSDTAALPMMGFSAEAAAAQREREAAFDTLLEPGNLRRWMQRMSARPHHVGSPHGRANAEMMVELFRSWGYDAEIATYHVLFPTPTLRRVELLAPTRFVAALQETALSEDTTSSQADEILPSYNAFSVDGDATGELVYVNYGVPDDYEELERRGISVEGRIVIARYGGSWRGIKPKVAAERGAIGCILYSDPRDDGYFVGSPYPEGGWRPAQGAQRGSVADMPLFPGDPLTPFVGATERAERLALDEAPTLTKIPVLPISHRDAQPLLEALEGPVAPAGWRGALPLTYRLGPGPAKVRLQLRFDWKRQPAHNVVARMKGSTHPDQWILRGNHHDAWVHGATDPVSGMVALLEEARGIGELVKRGWRPRRTIVYAGWDAEEPGLLGSTEWVEHHAEALDERAVVYINTDSNGPGLIGAGGSHTLEEFVNEVLREVDDPRKGASVSDRRRAWLAVHGDETQRDVALSGADLHLSPLGSGSDYTPFLQHLGIASLSLSYGGEGQYGQYHSAYDSFDHYVRFMDTDFSYGITLAKTCGRLVMRLADAPVLPFEFRALAARIGTYRDEVIGLADRMREETERNNRMVERGMYELAANPNEKYVPPGAKEEVPHLNFAPLRNAVRRLEASAASFDRASAAAADGLTEEQAARLNAILMRAERALTRKEGLPRRPWFVHHVYAPGFYTGYGVKTLPGIREAIEQRLWDEAEEQIRITAGVIERLAAAIDGASGVLAPE